MATDSKTAQAPEAEKPQQAVRPTRPNEDAFKAELAQAEKAHKASMDRLVSHTDFPVSSLARGRYQ